MTGQYIQFLIIFIILLIFREVFTYRKNLFLKYILTPLITFTSIVAALFSMNYINVTLYGITIIIGLILALIGDVLMMIEETDLFIHGLLFFFLAQLAYIFALAFDYQFYLWNIIPAVILLISIFYFYLMIKAKIQKHNMPVLIYMFAIGAMFYFALAGLNTGLSVNTLLFLTGALLFVISDVLIAINQFIKNIPNSTVIVWIFYAPGQLLIGLSCYYS